ncbi:hypothetical protein AAAU22_01235 [[Clostridium] symbiosum]|uniref:hypothetical protein n=1 Tax=Clostridium symbiosum TaxID=1512 RepID=UPI0032C0EEE9
MKCLFKKIKESFRSIVEIIMLVFAVFIPYKIDATSLIELCFKNTPIGFDNIKYLFLMNAGNWVIGVVFMLFLLLKFRKFNKEKMFNTQNVYHDYPYLWYWLCAKILGYEKCNLKLVPVFTQFRLSLNDTFPEYYVGADDDYPVIENEHIDIKKINYNQVSDEVNLILVDTYPIDIRNQIPLSKRRLSTIVIERKRSDVSRYYSPRFVAKTVDEVRNLPSNVKNINVFAATNPKHTLKISRDAFKLADRGNIEKLVVFPQEKKGIRKFGRKGKVIYSNR